MNKWLELSRVEGVDEPEELWAEPIPPNNDGFNNTKRRAAWLLASGDMSTRDIAAEIGISPVSLWRWGKEPEFRSLLKEFEARLDEEVYRNGLARKRARVIKLADMANHIEGVIRKQRTPSALLIREWRGLFEQIARELGQWSDKLQLSGEVEVRRLEITEVQLILSSYETEPEPEPIEAGARLISTGEESPEENHHG